MSYGLPVVLEALKKAGVKDIEADRKKLKMIAAAGGVSDEDVLSLSSKDLNPVKIAGSRKEGVPIEYILGLAPFMGRLFECSPDALIPREDTELLTRVLLSFIDELQGGGGEAVEIIEIGTGCGNIAVTLAAMTKNTIIRASDISGAALEIANRNVERHGVTKNVTLSQGDMFEPFKGLGLEGKIDIVACNPPYIPSSSLGKMDREIIDNEPVIALDAGTYGIDIFKRLISGAAAFLRPGGFLAFEFGEGQEKLVERLLSRRDEYGNFKLHRYQGVHRAASAARKC